MRTWHEGWDCLFVALSGLRDADLCRTATVRGQPMTAAAAITRQTWHYGWHVGQILLIAKHLRGADENYVTIPPGKTQEYPETGAGR